MKHAIKLKKSLSRPIFEIIGAIFFSLILVLFFTLNINFVSATTRTVTSNADSGAGTLRQALLDSDDGDTIVFNLSAGNETIVVSSTLTTPSGRDITIDGDNSAGSGTDITIQVTTPGTSTYPTITIGSGSGKTTTLRNLTLRGGNAGSGSGGTIYMFSTNASLVLYNCIVKDGRGRFGAGIWANGFANLTIENSTFQDNAADGNAGAARIDSFTGTVNIINSRFINNSAGVSDTSGSRSGGALYFYNTSVQGTVNIDKTLIYDNSARSGGGIYSEKVANLNISNSTISNNTGSWSTSGLAVFSGNKTITNTTISGNSSLYGSAALLQGGTSTLTNVTIIDNSSTDSLNNGLNIEVETLYIKNSLLANTENNDFSLSSSTVNDNGYNLVEVSPSYTWTGVGSITGIQANLNIDLVLGDNSSPYPAQTHALLAGSVAIDAGDSADNNGVSVPTTDQRGFYRNGAVDIGAFEFEGLLEIPLFTLSYATDGNGTIDGEVTQIVEYGENGTAVEAVPNEGYYFVKWSDDSLENPRTDINITENITIEAVFALISSVSNVSAESSSNEAIITWNSDTGSSSKVFYGPTSNLGLQTEKELSNTTSHSVTLFSLIPCTRYYYQVQSEDEHETTATSTLASFKTAGCETGTEIENGTGETIDKSLGGEVELINNNSLAKLIIPDNYATEEATFQINRLGVSSIVAPTDKELIDENIFKLVAIATSNGDQIAVFDNALTFVVTYDSSITDAFDEDTLDVYRYNNGTDSWESLGCELNKSNSTLTCTISGFSVYGVFGALNPPSSSSSGQISREYIIKQNLYKVKNEIANIIKMINALQALFTNTGLITSPPVKNDIAMNNIECLYFDINLSSGMDHRDVKCLQEFLNQNGFVLTEAGPGAKGNETSFFGGLTRSAVIRFQEYYKDEILTPLNLKQGTGFVGTSTRKKINELLTNI